MKIILITYVVYIVDVFFNRQSAFLLVQTELLFSHTSSYRDFIKGLFNENEEKLTRFSNFSLRLFFQ